MKTVGRAGTLSLGGLALAARGSEAATGWLARGEQPAIVPASLVRLDSNENPVGPAPAVIEAMKAAMSYAGRYPRVMGPDLVKDLARFHATAPDAIALGSGSGEILRMAVDAFTSPTRGLLTAVPTFESPAARARQLGHPLVEVPVNQRSLQIDLDGIAGARAGCRVDLPVQPEQPDGRTPLLPRRCGSSSPPFGARHRRRSSCSTRRTRLRRGRVVRVAAAAGARRSATVSSRARSRRRTAWRASAWATPWASPRR